MCFSAPSAHDHVGVEISPPMMRQSLRLLPHAACLALSSWLSTGTTAAQVIPQGFVYLRDIAPDIVQDIKYAGPDNFTGSKVPGYNAGECILLRAVAEALRKVQAELREQTLGLKVYDCYRPARATKAFLLWIHKVSTPTTTKRFFPKINRRSLHSLGYVSSSSAHSRGIAVDLTLVWVPPPAQQEFDPRASYASCTGQAIDRSPDNSIDMGSGFDCFDPMSHTESLMVTREQQDRRRLLRNLMKRHGFQGYDREWWHFTFSAGRKTGGALDFPVERRPG